MSNEMKIIIGGDLSPTKKNYDLFADGNIEELLGEELLKIWFESEFRLINLETPISDRKTPILKSGPNLLAPIKSIKGIKSLNVDLINLANNHIYDHGEAGLSTTFELLEEQGIPYVGAGKNIFEARKSFVINRNGIKVGVYSCAEHEFSIATDKLSGANPFEFNNAHFDIKCLKDLCDFVIVIFHAGKEQHRYPTPNLQNNCKFMVDCGADVVICQHSHCIGAYEEYKDKTIIYGQGNFLFDRLDNEFWNSGLLIQLQVGDRINIEYIPIVKVNNVVRLANYSDSIKILRDFELRSNQIMNENFVKETFIKQSMKEGPNYLYHLAGWPRLLRGIDKKFFKSKIIKKFYTTKKMLTLMNYIQCESHRETIIEYLDNVVFKNE